jgi:molecular chaperone GrpE
LRQLLDSEGLTPIEAAGQPFDPHQHEAIVQVETNKVPEGTVTAELQRGYRLRDRVLRPSLVSVAKAPTEEN